MRSLLLLVALLAGVLPIVCFGQSLDFGDEHRRGVNLGRQGEYDKGLAILRRLLDRYPDNYPVQRDFIIITTWKGDCNDALRRYKRVRGHPNQESYLIVSVAECLIKQNRVRAAIAMLHAALQRTPREQELKDLLQKAKAELAGQPRPEFEVGLKSDASDKGNREWLLRTAVKQEVADHIQLQARLLGARAADPAFVTGNLNRVGIGIAYSFDYGVSLTQDFSTDIYQTGETGSTTIVEYSPNALWNFSMTYASFAEDLPLRAKAQNVQATRFGADLGFHTGDYRWEWGVSTAGYAFSDANRRASYYSALGYAFELKPQREQRLILELSQSTNRWIPAATYYNPLRDQTTSLAYKLSLVFNTRFQRHADHLYLGAGSYDQQGIGAHGVWHVRYEQQYQFTDRTSLDFGIGYASRVYDGNREGEFSFNGTLRKKF